MKHTFFPDDFNFKNTPIEMPFGINNSGYIISDALRSAVEVAIFLGQPLLVTGEPGTGKTELAAAVAALYDNPELFVFNAKTTSTAKDLFYIYDSLGHFQYNQNITNKELKEDDIEEKFIAYQALGKAIKQDKQRSIVLIDEIDKAPRDFPNDILNEIDKLKFEVPEIKRTGELSFKNEKFRPFIIITSNSEKNLPGAFLRRCIFFHIEFPNDTTLLQILSKKIITKDSINYKEDDLKILVDHFNVIRKIVVHKQPATAELIYWVSILKKKDFKADKLEGINKLPEDDRDKEILKMSYSVLAKNKEDLKIICDVITTNESKKA